MVEVEVEGKPHVVCLSDHFPRDPGTVIANEVVFRLGEAWAFGPRTADHVLGATGPSDGAIVAPMPGRVTAVAVAEGEAVAKGQRLVVLEAMKMEQAMLSPFDGRVAELNVSEGAQVTAGSMLARIKRDD